MKYLLLLSGILCAGSVHSQQGGGGWKAFLSATFGNQNVYKTKESLTIKKVYTNGRPVKDEKEYTIIPNPQEGTQNFVRYKVVGENDAVKYIKVLPGCYFAGANIVYNNYSGSQPSDFPSDYVYQVDKKILVPNNHYLASSALIGKLISLPVRVRNNYWDNNNKQVEGALSIGYGFGWKYKLGNNPYHTHYLSTIFYGAGISQQKYFSVGRNTTTGKDTTTAKSDAFAVTYLSFGIAYEYEKFNIGIFLGKDRMFGSLRDWAYQDKWWWGLGIGYELFK